MDTPIAVEVFGGQVYVLEQGNGRVQRFSYDGTPLDAWIIDEDNTYAYYGDVTILPDGSILVTSSMAIHLLH
jgi:hypothetical protein